eukprot:jgi/Hompol1/2570/HPOL_002959-RA
MQPAHGAQSAQLKQHQREKEKEKQQKEKEKQIQMQQMQQMQTIFEGPQSRFLMYCKLGVGAFSVASLTMLPTVLARAAQTGSPTATETALSALGLTLAAFIIFTAAITNNYVVRISRSRPTFVPSTPASAQTHTSASQSLPLPSLREMPASSILIETRNLFNRPRLCTVEISDLRYKPWGMMQTWVTASKPTRRFFLDTSDISTSDPLFGPLWLAARRQSGIVEPDRGLPVEEALAHQKPTILNTPSFGSSTGPSASNASASASASATPSASASTTQQKQSQ